MRTVNLNERHDDNAFIFVNGLISRRKNYEGTWSHQMPRYVNAHGNLILDGHGQKRRTLDFEVGAKCGNRSDDANRAALLRSLERHVRVVRSLARELHFEIGVDCRCAAFGLRENACAPGPWETARRA